MTGLGRNHTLPRMTVKNLSVFLNREGVTTKLVNGISFSVEKGETLAIVGESGSSKLISSLAVMGLLPQGIRIEADEMTFDGQNLQTLGKEQMRQLRGRGIAMVFQEPMTSLNPVSSIGF